MCVGGSPTCFLCFNVLGWVRVFSGRGGGEVKCIVCGCTTCISLLRLPGRCVAVGRHVFCTRVRWWCGVWGAAMGGRLAIDERPSFSRLLCSKTLVLVAADAWVFTGSRQAHNGGSCDIGAWHTFSARWIESHNPCISVSLFCLFVFRAISRSCFFQV